MNKEELQKYIGTEELTVIEAMQIRRGFSISLMKSGNCQDV